MVVRQPAQQLRKTLEWSLVKIGVLVAIHVCSLERMKVDWIRAESPSATKILRVENLLSQSHPAARGPAEHYPRPWLSYRPELLLNSRVQFLRERVAVWTGVGGIHAIRIVVVGSGVIRHYQQHARKSPRGPILIKLVSLRIASAQHITGRRGLTKTEKVATKMALQKRHRILLCALVEIPWHKDQCIQKHGPPPKVRQQLAPHAPVAKILCVLRRID